MAAAAFFKHEGFLCDSFFSDILLPDLREQTQTDEDILIEHEPIRDLLILEFRSEEGGFTKRLNALLNQLESCCFYEISEAELDDQMQALQVQAEEEQRQRKAEEERVQEAFAYRNAHPEMYAVERGFTGSSSINSYYSEGMGCAGTTGWDDPNYERRPGK